MKSTIVLLFLIASLAASAQTQVLKGRIVDSSTQEGIAYTNIGVEGTFYGTASDAEGFFELKIPKEFQTEKLYISAVGYKNKIFDLVRLLTNDFNLIKLEAQTYDIAHIDIAAQSRVMFRVIKTASQNISKNYSKGSLGMKVYYSEEIVSAGQTRSREAIANVYDKNGYSQPSILDAFESRNFEFIQSKKDFEPYSFPAGVTGFEELLEMDVVRSASSILNEKLLNNYDLQLEGTSIFEEDSVWIISYKTNETDLPHTGDFYATKFEGKIYVSQSDYGIIRNECAIEATKNNSLNRSLLAKENAQENVVYQFTATYKKQAGKYVLAYLDCQKTFTNAENQLVSSSRKASILEVNETPSQIIGKDYFEDAAYVENFWRSFKKPL